MPSFSFSSSIRATSEERVLRLKVTHNLVHGLPSDRIHAVRGRVPKELDVLWLSDITISLSGSLDAHQIPTHDIVRSGLARHLRALLERNADRLGLNNVSHLFFDDSDGLSKLTLTPSRPLPQSSRPCANLVSLHLAYAWSSVAGPSDISSSGYLVDEASPFSSTLFLPIEALLNRVTEQFLIYHLVGRYPLIFGSWCKRLDLEMQYAPSIGHSIVEIMARSEDSGFLSKCKQLLKTARSKHSSILQDSIAALSSCTDAGSFESREEDIDPSVAFVPTDEQILCECLEQLFRVGAPQRRFKPTATPQFASVPQHDDGLLQSKPDEADDETSWVELSDTAMSPHTFRADCHQALTEDVDTFTKDWCEDGVWRPHEADTGPAATLAPYKSIMCEAQSDGSLIDASASLANITTRSPAASFFTHYRHPNVDYYEPDPAECGLHGDSSQIAHLGEIGYSAFAKLTHLPPRTPPDRRCFSDRHGQLTQDCQVELERFETLDSSSEREEEDSDLVLLEQDMEDVEHADGADANLDWLV